MHKFFTASQITHIVTVATGPLNHFLPKVLAGLKSQFRIIYIKNILINNCVIDPFEPLQSGHLINLGRHAHVDFCKHFIDVFVGACRHDLGHATSNIAVYKAPPKCINAASESRDAESTEKRKKQKCLQKHGQQEKLKKFAVIAIDSAIDYKFLLILLLNNSFI